VARLTIFEKDADYEAFEKVLGEAHERIELRIIAYTVMPNHWHLVVWPRADTDVTEFLQWLTVTHTMRWHAHYQTSGTGHLYQGRFKSFPVQSDEHLFKVLRYVERNPVRAGLVKRAQDWRWSSLWRRVHDDEVETPWLTATKDWPAQPPTDYIAWINRAETPKELAALARSVRRGTPFGSAAWTARVARSQKLESSLRDPWRPKKLTRAKTGDKK